MEWPYLPPGMSEPRPRWSPLPLKGKMLFWGEVVLPGLGSSVLGEISWDRPGVGLVL